MISFAVSNSLHGDRNSPIDLIFFVASLQFSYERSQAFDVLGYVCFPVKIFITPCNFGLVLCEA